MEKNRTTIPFSSTFISANSGNGFYSLYDSVFDTRKFDCIYVLFGGPGTGKSTFLRGIAQKAREMGCGVDEILCSSDPASLDALILSKGEKRVGVLDGTPPHGRIITAPAVKEELINLGAFWDGGHIATHKDKILSLAEKKKSAYARTYALLSALEGVWKEGYLTLLPLFDREKAKRHIRHKLQACKQKGEAQHRFMRAYSSKGEYRAKFLEDRVQCVLYIGGNRNAAEIYLTYFEEILQELSIERTVFHAPLTPKAIDAIYLNEIKTLLIKEELRAQMPSGRRIVADRFFPALSATEKERRALKEELTLAALTALKEAGEAHAAMEAYYMDGMDFEALERFSKQKTEQILAQLKD